MPEVIVKTGFDSRHWNPGDHVEIDEGARLEALLASGDVELVNPPAELKGEEHIVDHPIAEEEVTSKKGKAKKE